MNHHIGLLTHKGDTMNLTILENSLYWQKFVFNQSRNSVQKQRVWQRIVKLEQQIAQIKEQQ